MSASRLFSRSFLPDFSKQSLLFFVFTFCFIFWLIDLWRPFNSNKNESNFVWDMFGYYSYLPAIFLNDGSFEWPADIFTLDLKGPLGITMPKYTCGVAILSAPFFFIAMLVSRITGQEHNLGFFDPYATIVGFGSMLYVLIGIFLLRRLLLAYFSETTVTLTMVTCLYGTMLFMYTFIQPEMAHAYLFFLFCAFLECTRMFYETNRFRYLVLLSLAGGLIVLIRPVEIYVYVFFIFWDVKSFSQLQNRVLFFKKYFLRFLIIPGLAFIVWIPQLIFWKIYAGNYFYFSYGAESFFWSDPQIINILFSYRKGWITYTPAVVLAFIGFFIIKKNVPLSGFLFGGITLLTIYIFSCWWDWSYGGGYAAREFCQQIAYLSIPVASVIERVRSADVRRAGTRIIALLLYVFCFSCVCYNISQSYQYQQLRVIHPLRNSKTIYWAVYRTFQFEESFGYTVFYPNLAPTPIEWMQGKNRSDNWENE